MPPPPPRVSPTGYGAYPAAFVARQRSAGFYIAVIGGSFAVIALILMGIIGSAVHSAKGGVFSSKEIAVLDITGEIVTAEKIDTQLRRFADDDAVKAIILHINSPGGGASPSQEIYHEVLRLRQEKHKKIVASIDTVGASGAYYIASACDRIYANQASVVGSIGVVMEWTNYGDLFHWIKLKSIDIHDGELKTAGDPKRDMTPKEQAYFQSLVDNMYGQFIRDVATGRRMPEDKVKPLATGQVWTGQQALPLGLIDKEGGLRVAVMDTAKEVGITGEPSVLHPTRQSPGLLSLLFANGEELLPSASHLLQRSPGFYFLWQ
ncbi:MAG TPA: signal peptide peptidase SppA [Granulicella sp.]